MTGFGAPCGACKFLRRKCLKGCVFAPYFCHEEGAMHFAAIHKVFGASNVSKLLTNLPVSDRCQAAVSISYEALSRVQDPIYGCVSHIFALQQEVVNLETQLHFLRTLAAQNTTYSSSNVHGVFPSVNSTTQMQFYPNNLNSQAESSSNGNDHADPTTFVDYHHVGMPGENFAFNSLQDPPTTSNSMHTNRREWGSQDAEDLQSVAFPYL